MTTLILKFGQHQQCLESTLIVSLLALNQLEYVEIVGAGMLHGEKAPAVQTVMASPLLSRINISHCAADGINMVSPHKTMNMLYNKITDNLGVGISAAVLSGEVREADLSAFTPLAKVPLPYKVFGMVDICDPQKEIVIEERVLLYYKYDNNPGQSQEEYKF